MSNKDVRKFQRATQAPDGKAAFYLTLTNNHLDDAVELYNAFRTQDDGDEDDKKAEFYIQKASSDVREAISMYKQAQEKTSYARDPEMGLKRHNLLEWGEWAETHSQGHFQGKEWASTCVSDDICTILSDRAETLRQIVNGYSRSAYTREGAASSSLLDAKTVVSRLGIDKATFVSACDRAATMLINVELSKMQLIHLILIRNAFQHSSESLYRINDPGLRQIFSMVDVMVEALAVINRGAVVPPNDMNYDAHDLQNIIDKKSAQ